MPDPEVWRHEKSESESVEGTLVRTRVAKRPVEDLGVMNPDQIIPDKNNRAAIILAGGDGTRLATLTRRVDGVHVPKQFCAVLGEIPLLNQTRRRVSLSVPAERVSFVLNKEHERFFSPLLADVSRQNLIVQPRNRGTAPAILYSLLRLAESAPRTSVLLMPSDHHVGDEAALMKYVDLAFTAVQEQPHPTVLVGIAPDEPETAYGWIEPTPATDMGRQCKTLPVRRFWEKPSREVARELMATGCLWNTFIMVVNCRRFLVCSPARCRDCASRFRRSGQVLELASSKGSSAGYTRIFARQTSRGECWSQPRPI
jgi:mannose-1-phosphate guanylyltransferase